MSTETQAVENVEVKEREPLFSKKNRKLINNPLDADNPITVQVLGVCSALAVTVSLIPTLVMCISVLFVLIFSNLAISVMRNVIPGRIRIIVQLLVVATLVAIVDQVLQAYAYDVYKLITVFVGLIITNCIIMGRLEAFALANKPWPAFLDAVGNGLGYAVILIPVAFFRELFGSGSLLGINILGENYPGNGVMMSPVGACIVLGLIIWFQRARNGYTEEA